MKKFLMVIAGIFAVAGMSAKQYAITDFGAIADSAVLSTKAIQKAIDICSENGGGQVSVPAGYFLTGSLILKNNVDFHLESGAVLLGSRNLDDYIRLKPEYISLRTQEATIQLIYAENGENITISGQGTIDGQGRGFPKLTWNDEGMTRPHLLRFITCRRITVKDVTLKNSGCWMQHYLACEDLQIRDIRVFNRNNFNNDALDLDGCRNVTVSGIIADSDDDGITLKSTSPKPCENISITNCVVSSRCNAIKLGTETNGGFRNIQISGCIVKPSDRQAPPFFGRDGGISGVSLEIVDGGILENVSVSNLLIEGTESPLFIRLGNRARTYRKGVVIDRIGSISGVSVDNIRIRNAGKTGCSITGLPGNPVTDIYLCRIVMEQAGGGIPDDIHRETGEKPEDYPEATMFGTLPAYGFYIRHAENVTMDGVHLSVAQDDARPALYLDDVKNSRFHRLMMENNGKAEANIQLKNSHNIIIGETVTKGESTSFVKMDDKLSDNILLMNNILKKDSYETLKNKKTGKRKKE